MATMVGVGLGLPGLFCCGSLETGWCDIMLFRSAAGEITVGATLVLAALLPPGLGLVLGAALVGTDRSPRRRRAISGAILGAGASVTLLVLTGFSLISDIGGSNTPQPLLAVVLVPVGLMPPLAALVASLLALVLVRRGVRSVASGVHDP